MPRKKPLFGVWLPGADLLEQVLGLSGIDWPVHSIPWSNNSQSTAEIDRKTWKSGEKWPGSCGSPRFFKVSLSACVMVQVFPTCSPMSPGFLPAQKRTPVS